MEDSNNSGYVFNAFQWNKIISTNLTEEQILTLDDRYINVGENVPSQNVDNLNLINLHVASSGKILFYKDNT